MKKVVLCLVAIVVLYLTYAIGWSVANNAQAQKTTQAPTRAQLLSLVNAERAKNNVAPLVEDPRLDASAQFKASDEFTNRYFGHVVPGGTGNNGLDFAQKVISCKWYEENLRENGDVNTAKATVNAWIASPTHHAAMIDGKYTLTGFGIDGNEIVEHFCQTF